MKKVGFFIVGLIVGFMVWLLLPKKEPTISTITISDTVTKYVPTYDTTFIPIVQYRDTGTHTILVDSVWVSVHVPVDTQAIVKDYLTVKGYSFDTTFNNVNIIDSIWLYANSILKYSQYINVNNKKPNVNHRSFNGGLWIGTNEVTPILTFVNNNYTFMAGYDFVGQDRGVRIGLTKKIR